MAGAAGRDRIVSPAEFRTLWDKAEGDREMRALLALAGTTTMRKGEVLSLRWDRVHLEDAPYVTLVRTKNGHQRHVPIPQSIVKALKALPSHGSHEYLFPSRPTARCPEPQRPYRTPASTTAIVTGCARREPAIDFLSAQSAKRDETPC